MGQKGDRPKKIQPTSLTPRQRKVRLLFCAVCAVLFAGCRGKDGAPGPQGTPGNFFGSSRFIQGSVTSDSQTIAISNFNVENGDWVTVYVCNASNVCDQVNRSQVGVFINMFYETAANSVTLSGVQSAGFNQYDITVVNRA